MGQEKKIKILSPVDNFYEARALIDEGVDELYGGLFPSSFKDYSYFLSPNQRTFKEAQMDEREFEKTIKLCREKNIPFYLTINQLYFKYEQLPLIIKLAEYAIEMGVSGLIMGSLPLILNVRKKFPDFPIHLSTMAVALNHHAVSFFKELNVKRVTLSRSLSIKEIKSIVKNSPHIDFDTFILIGKCPNIEGFCSLLHTNPQKIWPCEQRYNYGGSIEVYKIQKEWQGFYRSQSCGICGISEIIKSGVSALKIVGRGSPASFKIENVRLVKKALILTKEIKDSDKRVEALKNLYYERFNHHCNPFCCYFPEIGFKK